MSTRKGAVRTVNKALIRSRWAAIGAAVAVTLGGGTFLVANAAAPPSLVYKPLTTPCRLLDTRNSTGFGIWNGKIEDKSSTANDITVVFDKDAVATASPWTSADDNVVEYVAGSFRPIMGTALTSEQTPATSCDKAFFDGELAGVEAEAVQLNVTSVAMTANGYITVYPWKANRALRPGVSNLNPVSGFDSIVNMATIKLEPITQVSGDRTFISVRCQDGTVGSSDCATQTYKGFRVFNANGSVHVVIDVMGVYTTS